MSMMHLDPALLAGWEPRTPLSDSVVRRFLENWVIGFEALARPLAARTLRRDDLSAVDVGRPAFIVNSAMLHAPLFPDRVDDIAATLDDFYGLTTGEGTGRVYLWSPWPTADLRAHGWTLAGHPPLMLRAGGEMPEPPAGLRIEQVGDEASLRAAEEVTAQSFGFADITTQMPGAVFHPGLLADERIRMWVGWEGDRPVSASATVVAGGINNVINVATIAEARGHGYGAAIAWRATLADPTRPAMLIASHQGRPVYERMGYLPLFRFTLWSRTREGKA